MLQETRSNSPRRKVHNWRLGRGPQLGRSTTAMSHNALADTGSPAEMCYVGSGASDHLIPSRDTYMPIKNVRSPLRYQQPMVRRSMLTVLGPSAWQRQPTTWDEKQIYRTYYVPEVHARLVSLGKLEGQERDVRLTMELRDRPVC